MPGRHYSFVEVLKKTHLPLLCAVVFILTKMLLAEAPPASQELVFELDPAKSSAGITLSASFHSVEGSFLCKRGAIHYDPATGKASGEIVFDATSGQTGNDGRDHKMHKDVLRSERFPDIAFHPDHAEGQLAASGESTLEVHGMFAIHGTEHEITIPVEMSVKGNSWTAKAAFVVPYVKWGMKNPSVLLLRVGSEVKVQFHGTGTLLPQTGSR